MVDVRIEGANQLGALAKRLKDAGDDGKKLRKELLKAVRAGAKPAVADTKTAIKTLPVKGSRGGGSKKRERHAFNRSFGAERDRALDEAVEDADTEGFADREDRARRKARRGAGLRNTIAGAIRLQVKTGTRSALVRIEVDASKLPTDQRSLPHHLDTVTGWRHPTFGRSPWVKQQGKPWFEVTIRKHLPVVRANVLKALDDIAKKVEG